MRVRSRKHTNEELDKIPRMIISDGATSAPHASKLLRPSGAHVETWQCSAPCVSPPRGRRSVAISSNPSPHSPALIQSRAATFTSGRRKQHNSQPNHKRERANCRLGREVTPRPSAGNPVFPTVELNRRFQHILDYIDCPELKRVDKCDSVI